MQRKPIIKTVIFGKKLNPEMVKRISSVVFIFLLILLLAVGYFQKDKLNGFISKNMAKKLEPGKIQSTEELVNSKYNYVQNGENYEFTLMEFGSTGCVICKQMEGILDEIKKSKSNKINVVFLHTMNPENQDLIKYFGISAIPMQVLLDKNGKVFFKNYGFISANDLLSKFSTKSIQN